MNAPSSSWNPSSKAPTPINLSPFRRALLLCGFILTIAVISCGLSIIALPFVHLPWWKIVRRCVSISTLLSVWLFMRYVHRQPFRSLGLVTPGEGWKDLRRGLWLGGTGVALLVLAYLSTGQCRVSLGADPARLWQLMLVNIPAMGLVAIGEEVIFRGYLLQQLLGYSKIAAIILTSAVYAVVHLKPNPVWPSSGLEVVGLFLLGAVLALSALRTRQLSLSIGLHGVLAYVARLNKFFLAFSGESVQWLVGTNRLVNGVGAWVAFLGIGWWVMMNTARSSTSATAGRTTG